MRAAWFVIALAFALSGCEQPGSTPRATAPSNLVVVRDFTISASTRVVVDTSFGFNLNRGQPGVPLAQRGAGLARAAAFNIADALTEQLRQLGYDAVHAHRDTPDPAGRALIVTGTLSEVNEGHRRQVGDEHAKVAADAEIDEWTPGIRPALALHLDSDALAGDNAEDSAAVAGAARRVGRELARRVAEIARKDGFTPK
ncbi:MAG TPA: hypothetical protein VGG57_00840 [Stellaceae bacterium]|jgi:hypothetical protein